MMRPDDETLGTPPEATERAIAAYSRRAVDYAERLGSMQMTADADRRLVGSWAATINGPIIDVGCGPGHWTDWLRDRGHDIVGLDPVPAFIEHARKAHPQTHYDIADIDSLHAGSAAGTLAWYSLIHLPPEQLPAALAQLRETLIPGGSLLIGFFDGSDVQRFDHAVTPAWFWPADVLSSRLVAAGFRVTHVEQRHDPGSRPHAAITAQRADG